MLSILSKQMTEPKRLMKALPADFRCHVFRHQHHGKFHRIGNALDGRQTGIALAALNL